MGRGIENEQLRKTVIKHIIGTFVWEIALLNQYAPVVDEDTFDCLLEQRIAETIGLA